MAAAWQLVACVMCATAVFALGKGWNEEDMIEPPLCNKFQKMCEGWNDDCLDIKRCIKAGKIGESVGGDIIGSFEKYKGGKWPRPPFTDLPVCELSPCNFWRHVGQEEWSLVIFYAEWCTVSKQFQPMFTTLARRFQNENVKPNIVMINPQDGKQMPAKFFVGQTNVEHGGSNFAEDFKIETLPAFVLFPRECYNTGGCHNENIMKFQWTGAGPLNDISLDDQVDLVYKWVNDSVFYAKNIPRTEPPREASVSQKSDAVQVNALIAIKSEVTTPAATQLEQPSWLCSFKAATTSDVDLSPSVLSKCSRRQI